MAPQSATTSGPGPTTTATGKPVWQHPSASLRPRWQRAADRRSPRAGRPSLGERSGMTPEAVARPGTSKPTLTVPRAARARGSRGGGCKLESVRTNPPMLDSRLHLCVAALVVAVLVAATGATAKDFRPGDLRVCNTKRCVQVRNPAVLAAFGSFYYNGPQPDTAPRARLRAP